MSGCQALARNAPVDPTRLGLRAGEGRMKSSAPVAPGTNSVSSDRSATRKDLQMNNPRNDSRAFEGLEGCREYQRFDESVTTGGRHFRDAVAELFLASVRASYDDRCMIVAAGKRYCRAQPGCVLSRRLLRDSETITEQDLPHPPDRMKPIVSWNHEGVPIRGAFPISMLRPLPKPRWRKSGPGSVRSIHARSSRPGVICVS